MLIIRAVRCFKPDGASLCRPYGLLACWHVKDCRLLASLSVVPQNLRVYGGEVTDEMEDEFYLQSLEAGLFTLQIIDYVMLEISTSAPPTVSVCSRD